MINPTKFTVFIILFNIIIGSDFFHSKIEALRLTKCEVNNSTLECQAVPVDQAGYFRRAPGPISISSIIIGIVGILITLLLLGCLCLSDSPFWEWNKISETWETKESGDLLKPPIPLVENGTAGAGGEKDIKINSVADEGADTNVESQPQLPDTSGILPLKLGLEAREEVENHKVAYSKKSSPVDCVLQVCACV
ncbi:unnamed protein product [Orchesella dallaii]|uniref:Uncharacterized protein n=1 Tax=Orchesella dallaii TaxID=48710 RepID=A0ABP1S863_9HEXA